MRRGVENGGNFRLRIVGDTDWALELPMIRRCLFCGAEFAGTTAETAALWRSHHDAEHPQARDRGQRARILAAKAAAA